MLTYLSAILLSLSALLSSSEETKPPAISNMENVVREPWRWNGKTVVLCGRSEAMTAQDHKTQRTVYIWFAEMRLGLAVDPDLVAHDVEGVTCYLGVVRRVDGLSEKAADEQKKRRLYEDISTHPEFILTK